jgi:hypothetical protein
MAINTTLSNAYVERASSEHPISIWTLNEEVDYVSHISDEERQLELFSKWEIVGGEATSYPGTSLLNTPFPNSPTTRIEGAPPAPAVSDIVLRSKFPISENFLDKYFNFVIGCHIYMKSELSNSVSIGYEYDDPETLEVVEVLKTVATRTIDIDKWKFFSQTLELPPEDVTEIRFLIKVNITKGGLEEQYDFFINGLTVGQWAEEFVQTSYGLTPSDLPSNIALPAGTKAIPAFPYGAAGDNAYYLSKEYELVCTNFGVPLVYGSSNVTKISPNVSGGQSLPSIIFPGYGFLNEVGKFNTYTVEMWVRINSAASSSKKIFGPIASSDGLYVDDAFLTLKVGDQYTSHFIGEWYRPMLVHIRYTQDSAILLINGEEVLNLELNQNDITFPEDLVDNKSQNWLGFYAYEDVPIIDLDSFSIYPYSMPTQVAKRHFVWGQAITPPEQTNSALNAVTAFNDYAFANYTANYNYPDFANWKQAFFSNVNAESKSVGLPDYVLPEFKLTQRTKQDLFDQIDAIIPDENDPDDELGRTYLTLGTTALENEYFYFKSLNILNDPIESIYGVFKTDGTEVNKPIVKIVNKGTNDYFLISIDGTTLTYLINISGLTSILATKTIEADKKFTAGINLLNISKNQIAGINRFFANQASLDLSIAGDSNSKFFGKIYKFGLDGSYNNKKIREFYNSQGIFDESEETAEDMFIHTANYTLVGVKKYGIFFADIAVAGYWEDYMPLSYFAKSITDSDGNQNYELDVLQFNLDFPEPNSNAVEEQTEGWTYGELFAEYRSPITLLYRDLNNKFFTKWENYQDMNEQSIKTIFFNTEKSTLRSYVSFQRVANGANTNLEDFNHFAKPLANGIVDPDGTQLSWEDTAYELTTGTLIYPPTLTTKVINNNETKVPVDFNDIAIVYHLEFKSEGILHQPIRIKELQLASQVFERTTFTPVGSKFGVPVYYYNKAGVYFDLKGKNPIATYKKSTPHLYLNRQSGWKLRGEFELETDRGIAVPVNTAKAFNTEVSSIQMWIRFADKEFPGERVKIFSIDHNNGIYDFYLQADSSMIRGFVTAFDRETGQVVDTFNYFLNGKKIVTPFLVKEEWTVLAIEFPDLLNFSSRTGTISLNGPLMYNNVSYNLATNLEKDESIETRLWGDIKTLKLGNISNATTSGSQVTYSSAEDYAVGNLVTITGAIPAEYNVVDAEILSVTSGSFTIAGTRTAPYSIGGKVSTSSWGYVKTDLVVTDNSKPPFTWRSVRVLSQARTFEINPEQIYAKYTGSDRIIIDDQSRGILIRPELIRSFNNITWNQAVQTPV